MTYQTFGNFIKGLRTGKGLSLRKSGRQLGISFNYLDDIEQGRRPSPSRSILKAMVSGYCLWGNDRREFYDMAGGASKGCPVPQDVLEILEQDSHIITMIRNMKGI